MNMILVTSELDEYDRCMTTMIIGESKEMTAIKYYAKEYHNFHTVTQDFLSDNCGRWN